MRLDVLGIIRQLYRCIYICFRGDSKQAVLHQNQTPLYLLDWWCVVISRMNKMNDAIAIHSVCNLSIRPTIAMSHWGGRWGGGFNARRVWFDDAVEESGASACGTNSLSMKADQLCFIHKGRWVIGAGIVDGLDMLDWSVCISFN